MSAIEARVRKLEQVPAYATKLLVQQALDKLAAGVPVQGLTDAELDALSASAPPAEKARLAAMTDAELDAFIATQEAC